LAFVPVWAAEPLLDYSTDWVTSSTGHTFATGALNGQDGWSDPAGKATVTTAGLSLTDSTWNNPSTWVLRPESVLDQHLTYTFAAGAIPSEFFAVGRYRSGLNCFFVHISGGGTLRAGKFVGGNVTWNPNNSAPLTANFNPAHDSTHAYQLDVNFLAVAGASAATRILATATDLTAGGQVVATYDQTVTEAALAQAGQAGWYVAGGGSSRLTGFAYADVDPSAPQPDWEVNVPVSDPNIYWSPNNWWTALDGAMKQTSTGGAYLKVAFTGSKLGLAVLRAGAPDDLAVTAYVDGATSPTTQVTLAQAPATGEAVLPLATGLATNVTHTATVHLTTNSEGSDRWNGDPPNALRVVGLALDDLAATVPLGSSGVAPKSEHILFFGDSITQWGGENRWTNLLAAALGYEHGNIAYSGQGWSKTAPGGAVPFFYPDGGVDTAGAATWRWHSQGKTRLTESGAFQDGAPAAVFVNMGTNDATNNTNVAGVKDKAKLWLADIRTAAPDAAVYVVTPFCAGSTASVTRCDTVRDLLKAAVVEYAAAHPGARVYAVDLGQDGYDWTHSPYGDSIHPNAEGNALIAQRVERLLTPAAPTVWVTDGTDGTSVTLAWDSDSPYVTGYEVRWRETGSAAWTEAEAEAEAEAPGAAGTNQVVFEGLDPEANYDFQVVATTPLTRSPAALVKRFVTEETLCTADEDGLVAVACPRLVFSPYTWHTRTDGAKQAVTSGSYVRFAFTGSFLGLSLLPDSIPSNQVQIDVAIDGGAPVSKRVNAADQTTGALAFATGLAAGLHQAEVYISQTPNPGKYTGELNFPASVDGHPRGSLVIQGVRLAPGATVAPTDQLARPVSDKRIMIYGDSITESSHHTGTYHAQESYAGHLGRLLGVEYGQLGYSGYAYLAKGFHDGRADPDAAAFADVWPNYFYGQPKVVDGAWVEGSPDAIILALGHNDLDYCATTNDMGLLAATVADTLAGLRAASGPDTEILLMPPFKTGAPATVGSTGGSSCPLPVSWPEFKVQVFEAGLDLYQTSHRNANQGRDDARTQIIDLGEIGYHVVQNWPDSDKSVHPGPESSRVLAEHIKEALAAAAPVAVAAARAEDALVVRWDAPPAFAVSSTDDSVDGLPLSPVVTGYRVEWQTLGAAGWTTGATVGPQVSATLVDGVDPSQVTDVRVIAFNALTETEAVSAAAIWETTGLDPVASVEVTGPAAITVRGATAQYAAAVAPDTAVTHEVAWWLTGVDGAPTDKAVIDSHGILTPAKNGRVVVHATALDGSGATDELEVTISGQSLAYLSVGKPVTASGVYNNPAANAVDGNLGTRWTSETGTHTPWIYVDLGSPANLSLISLAWEAANATQYKVQVSNDALEWVDLQEFTVSAGARTDQVAAEFLPTEAYRYVKMQAAAVRNTGWGVSVFEFSIDGTFEITQPVVSLQVAGQDGTAAHSKPGRSFQMAATASPVDATDPRVEWYVYDAAGAETGAAEITAGGLLTASNGEYMVVARAVDGSGVEGSRLVTVTGQERENLALGQTVTVTGGEQSGAGRQFAVDGDHSTRWAAASLAVPQEFTVDLGAVETISLVTIYWETARATQYTVQVSETAGGARETVCAFTDQAVGLRDCEFEPVKARYVTVNMTQLAISYGPSIWEFEVYGPPAGPAPLTLSATAGVKCVAGKAYLTVTAVNESDVAASLTVTTPYGVKVFPSIEPGKAGFHSFTTRVASYSDIAVNVAGLTVDGVARTGAAPVVYATASCA
jgi:lysophospholipase L1-like esterase